MPAMPFAHALINSVLPKQYHFKPSEVVNKKTLKHKLVRFAKEDPQRYTEVIPIIKQHGDLFATYEGISVGLDDIEPDYAARNPILEKADKQLRSTTDPKTRTKIYLEAQAKVRDIAAKHKGDLGLMARSGGRGNVNQLMKTVASPVVVGDFNGNPVDTLIKRSYSEGLSPAEYWVAGDESRGQVIKGQLGTAEPGDVSKILANTANRQVISGDDCGTKNGQRMPTNDPHVLGRFLARDQTAGKRNTEVTQRVVDSAKAQFLFVRSPLTCEAHDGVCSYCQGIMAGGQRMSVGENPGLRSAQAMSEPLTQMALSSKHGVALVEGAANIPRGLNGLRQFLEAPKSFAYKAILSKRDGTVTKIKPAPQGGNYIHVGTSEHYAPPGTKVKVRVGQKVEQGDVLTEGFANPTELIAAKGLGAGRKYLTERIHDIYKESGIDLDKRNIENIVAPHLNFVQVEEAPEDSGLLPGETIKQNRVASLLQGKGEKVSLSSAKGRIIAENYLHHTAGTTITDSMIQEFQMSGITKVNVVPANTPFKVKPFMTSIAMAPLLDDNWLNKLGHRYLQQTIVSAAHGAEEADTSGYAPIAAYVRGTSGFGKGPKGRY